MTSGVSQLSSPRRSHVVSIIVGFGIPYSLTPTWGYEANVDAIAATLPAWSLAERGEVLDQFASLNPWLVEGTFRVMTNRPPGAWAVALPSNYLARAEMFTNAPATATAIIFTGILTWSPVVAFGVVGAFQAWSTLPSWARSTATAALVYLIVHARLNRVSGGTSFSYRYPLEALVLAAPALTVGAARIGTSGRAGKLLTQLAIGLSVALEAALVLLLSCESRLGAEMVCTFR